MNKLWILLTTMLFILAFTGVANAAEMDDEYIMNITLDDNSYLFANHTDSETEGNWISLGGGEPVKLPSPISFTYNGVNETSFNINNKNIKVNLNVNNYSDHIIKYPFDTHQMYTNTSSKNNVSYQFGGSTYFANKDAKIVLIESGVNSIADIFNDFKQGNIDSISDITSLDKVHTIKTKTLNSNGDTSGEFENLDAGEYSVLIFLDNEPVILSATAFDVLDYGSIVNTNLNDDTGTLNVNIHLKDAPNSVNYTYGSAIIKKSEYKAEALMNFNGSKDGLNLSVNNEPIVDKFDLIGLDISDLNKTDIKNRASDFIDNNKMAVQLKSSQMNNTNLSLDVNGLERSDYILLSGAISGNNLVALNQSNITLVKHDFKMAVDNNTQSVEQDEDATYNLRITNTGNVKENVSLTNITVPGVKSSLKTQITGLMPGETEIVELNVSSSSVGESNPVIVIATLESSGKRQVVTTRTTVIDALDVSVDSKTKATKIGENATYNLTITNTGDKKHKFNISKGPSDIGKLNKNNTTLLGPGESEFVEYVVNSSKEGVFVADITVNESTNHNITERLFLITNVKEKKVYGVSLSTDDKTKTADNGKATYNITIVNTGNQEDTYDLTVVNPRANKTELDDNTSVNLKPGTKTVRKLNVSESNPGSYNVKVVGVSQNSSKMDKVNTITKVNGYGVIVTADSYSATTKPGNTANYTLTIKNTGDVKDNFTLTNTNNVDSITMPTEITGLEAGDTESFDVALSNSNTGDYYANITATSEKDPEDANNTVDLSLNVESEDEYGVSVTADPGSETIEKNENVTYVLNIKNTGNVGDDYSISSELDNAKFDTNQTTLDAGESTDITMTVTGLEDIKTYSIPITVSSDNSEVKKDKTVYAEVISAVDITATPGTQTIKGNNASNYVIEVTNTGNKIHSYNLSADNSSDTTANFATANIPDLSPGESSTVDFSFDRKDDSRKIETSIKAEVQNEPEKSSVTSVSALYLDEDVYGVSIETDTKQQSIGKGKNATYFLTIKNLGNTNESFNLTTVEGKDKYLNFQKSIALNASGTDNDAKIISVTHSPKGAGDHTVKIKASSNNTTDTVEFTTRVVVPPKPDKIINSIVDGKSAVIGSSYIDPSIVENSLINNTTITDSTVKDSKLVNSTIKDSNLKNIEFKNGYIGNNTIHNGTLVVDGTEYVIEDSDEPIELSELIIGVDNLDSSVSGVADENTEIAAGNSNVKLTIGNDGNYVGGTLNIQRSNIASNGTNKLLDNVSGYVNIEESNNINESMEHVKLNFSYNPEDAENIDENNLYIYWYDESSGKWVPLKGAGDPDFCKGVSRNIEENYVTATVTHLSTYSIGPVEETDTEGPDDTGGDGDDDGVSGGSTSSGEPSENIADKFVQMKYLNKNKSVTYEFDGENNPINSVKFTPLINTGYVNVVVEVLEDTSTFVDEKPDGEIYKNMNIFIGKDNWANEDTITNPTISFSVDKSWLNSNNIDPDDVALLRFDANWEQLPTTVTDEDTDKVYYTAETPGYSPFVIIGSTVSGDEFTGPTADFTANTTSGTAPLEVLFTDQSENADSWRWSFGDGTNSTKQNPTHTYEEPGNYTVTLTVSNEDSSATETVKITVNDEDKQPERGIPGFEAIFVVAGLIAVAYLVRRFR